MISMSSLNSETKDGLCQWHETLLHDIVYNSRCCFPELKRCENTFNHADQSNKCHTIVDVATRVAAKCLIRRQVNQPPCVPCRLALQDWIKRHIKCPACEKSNLDELKDVTDDIVEYVTDDDIVECMTDQDIVDYLTIDIAPNYRLKHGLLERKELLDSIQIATKYEDFPAVKKLEGLLKKLDTMEKCSKFQSFTPEKEPPQGSFNQSMTNDQKIRYIDPEHYEAIVQACECEGLKNPQEDIVILKNDNKIYKKLIEQDILIENGDPFVYNKKNKTLRQLCTHTKAYPKIFFNVGGKARPGNLIGEGSQFKIKKALLIMPNNSSKNNSTTPEEMVFQTYQKNLDNKIVRNTEYEQIISKLIENPESEKYLAIPREIIKNKEDEKVYFIMKRYQCSLQRQLDLWDITLEGLNTIFGNLFRALEFLHKQNIIHRDIKPGNILIEIEKDSTKRDGIRVRAKIADLGLATQMDPTKDQKKTVCGTFPFIAPELMRQSSQPKQYEIPKKEQDAPDIWALGMTLLATLNPKAFDSLMEKLEEFVSTTNMSVDQLQSFIKDLITEQKEKLLVEKNVSSFDHLVKNDWYMLLENMLNCDPLKRYTASECLKGMEDISLTYDQYKKSKRISKDQSEELVNFKTLPCKRLT